jgi:cytoskeletal protein RodZ
LYIVLIIITGVLMEEWLLVVLAVLGILSCLWYLTLRGYPSNRVKKLSLPEVPKPIDSRSEYLRTDSLAQEEWEKAFKAATAWDELARMATEPTTTDIRQQTR